MPNPTKNRVSPLYLILKQDFLNSFALGFRLIKENPYGCFQDKRGEKSKRPHLTETQLKKLIHIREESTDIVMNRHLDFLLFQTFTDMTYSDVKSFNYELHVETSRERITLAVIT